MVIGESVSRTFFGLVVLLALSCGGSVEHAPGAADSSMQVDATVLDGSVLVDGNVNDTTILDSPNSFFHDTSPTIQDGPMTAPDGYFPDATCGPGNCPNGCCNPEGFCVDPPTNEFCGNQGETCFSCGAGQCQGQGAGASCFTTVDNCGPANCGGCCVGTGPTSTCISGTFSQMCGTGGSECTICAPGSDCRPVGFDAGGHCQANSTGCGPDNCTGCCLGKVCAEGNQTVACGWGGQACKTCPSPGWDCGGGFCICVAPMFDAGTCNTDAGEGDQ
jgi:hypothetical protein